MNKLLKPLLLIALCAFLAKQGWQAREAHQAGELALPDVSAAKQPSTALRPTRPEAVHPSLFKCDGRTRCAQMGSCEEAKFFLAHCPNTQLDSDANGLPCEKILCD
ncbi:MAG TPA: excalibur calcium-binding domain-containing protein [Arenimonas sp.]|nr:excalibur calcium-binding domain-containing protein [Arenimonas sp.]